MKTPDTIQQEINRIRREIDEETKDMTPAQRAEHTNRIGEAIASRYGLKVVSRANEKTASVAHQS